MFNRRMLSVVCSLILFLAMAGQAQTPASDPVPADGAVNLLAEAITLTWAPGEDAILHNVYFGTDLALVEARDGTTSIRSMSLSNTVDIEALDIDTAYYWVVDEWAATGDIIAGAVWSFSTLPIIEVTDPNLVAWWTLDEGTGTTVLDQSGHGHHGMLGGDAQWADGAVQFDGDGDYVDFGTPEDLYLAQEYTYSAWFKVGSDIQGDSGAQYLLCVGSRSDLLFGVEDGVGVNGDLSLHYYDTAPGFHAVNAGRTNWLAVDEWHMVVGTRDAEGHKIYVDGALRNSDDNPNLDNFDGATTRMISLGGRAWTGHQWYNGMIDDVRIYDRALTAEEIRPMGSDLLAAWDPQPADGAPIADFGAIMELTWLPGDEAVEHDVYVGTDRDLVVAGDASVYQGRVEAPSYTPAEDFVGDATHFWRIDEINADASVTAGPVWSFSVGPSVLTSQEAWVNTVAAALPTYFATDVVDGVYDIGELSGDISYEFIVKSNRAETQASMALIGRRNFGDTNVGIKYEQWNNTGTYGATVFGVADYDYGVATNPGVPTHLVFVSSEDAATTALYVDGVLRGSIDSAITLSGLTGIGYGAQAEDGNDFFDDFDGDIFGVAIYDNALSSGQIGVHADAYFLRGARDITVVGDVVVGVPNDGDWPDGETPDLAIDDDTGTKFLHFKGFTEPTGIQVAPAIGSTIVTGLTLTTANDSPERDPVSFELYGSNESIEGPYELIAIGDVNDFAAEEAWPRFTMNATAIEFENTVAYAYYQVLFPTVRDAGSANSMQIAEIELIGVFAPAAVFAEDFEGLPLGPNVDEAVAGDAVWTKTAPEGWSIDDSAMAGVGDPATDGVTEWAGWSFADKAWWIEAAEDQDRSLFTLGSGTVAIGDPDEWDDADHTEGYFNSFLTTPAIDVSAVESDVLQLTFASSWRPEFDSNYHQTANITVSFDGGDPVEVLLWESDSESANYKPYATNETVTIGIVKPDGAQSMVLDFGLFDAGNDWWWAIDNVKVTHYLP